MLRGIQSQELYCAVIKSLATSEPQIARRVVGDIVKRGKGGELVYPVLWLLIGVASGFFEASPWIFSGVLAVFVVVAIVRMLVVKRADATPTEALPRWETLMMLSIVPHPFLWGSMFAYALTLDNAIYSVFMAFSTAGICAGGANTFAPSRKLSFAFIIAFLTPGLVASLLITHTILIGTMIVAFYVYMLALSSKQYAEYWRALENEIKLSKQSRTDALTELDNRRYFDEKLEEFCHLSSRNHEQLSVLVIDCDFFKQINDKYGHDTGDACLRHLAQVLQSTLARATDVLSRYGGEEFTVILPGTDVTGAEKVCEKVRLAVSESPLDVNGNAIPMTVSIGCVSRRINRYQPGLPDELFKQADMALYEAKKAGRNCCFMMEYDHELQLYSSHKISR